MKCGGHVTRWNIKLSQAKLWFVKLKGIGCMGGMGVGVGEKVILRRVFKKSCGQIWTEKGLIEEDWNDTDKWKKRIR